MHENTEIDVATHGSYRSSTVQGEMFVRYSAFDDDLRINKDGTVQEGTYVTTEVDSVLVPSGLAAIARFALPNRVPAKYQVLH